MSKLNLKKLLLIAIVAFGVTGVTNVYSYTRTCQGGWTALVGLYDKSVQTDSSTTCTGNGFQSCPGKESWQKLTDLTTSDGGGIIWLTLDADVINDMGTNNVPTSSGVSSLVSGYLYTGTVHSNYINKATNEMVHRSAIWKANSMHDYTYTTYVNVTPIAAKP